MTDDWKANLTPEMATKLFEFGQLMHQKEGRGLVVADWDMIKQQDAVSWIAADNMPEAFKVFVADIIATYSMEQEVLVAVPREGTHELYRVRPGEWIKTVGLN